jgi:uncharacterized protein YerC
MTEPISVDQARLTLKDLAWYRKHQRWLVVHSVQVGLAKAEVHDLTGISRSTIDRWVRTEREWI